MGRKGDKFGSPYCPTNRIAINKKVILEENTVASISDQARANVRDIINAEIFTGLRDEYLVYTPYTNPSKSSKSDYEYNMARQSVAKWIVTPDENSFDDIVGNDDALAKLRDAITAPVEQAELYAAYGMKPPKGAMLYGPPGCGKTMFARAAATEMRRLYGTKVEFIMVSGPELQSMYVGQTERHIREIFTFARAYKEKHGHPLLIFIDEADSILPDRNGAGGRQVYGWEESQVAAFLAEMDGVRESGAFVLLATNRPHAIDQAVLRDGRCDFKIEIKRPTTLAMEAILTKAFGKEPMLFAEAQELVFAAVEALCDPTRVIAEARAIKYRDGTLADAGGRSFLLEHIVSGAMVVGVVSRAKAHAFARDRALSTRTGIQVSDVIRAVNDVFEENKNLPHSFAMQEFMRESHEMLEKNGRLK